MSNSFFNYFFSSSRSGALVDATRLVEGISKKYKRFPCIALPKPSEISATISSAIMLRKSSREFVHMPISLSDLSSLLFWSAGVFDESVGTGLSRRRAHPSGGTKFPLELYLIVLQCEGVSRGVYHYNATDHTLELLPMVDVSLIMSQFNENFASEAGVIFLISCIIERLTPTYGNASYKLALLEGGHIGQNIYLLASALKIGCCALGIKNPTALNKSFYFNTDTETFIYGLALGSLQNS